MKAQKRNRLIAASVVTIVLLLFILVAILIYQLVEICVLNNRRKDIKEQITQYEEQLDETEDLIEYYQTQDGLRKLYIEYGLIND